MSVFTGGIYIRLNNGLGAFTPAGFIETTPDFPQLFAADFTHDGNDDLAMSAGGLLTLDPLAGNGRVARLTSRGDGSFTDIAYIHSFDLHRGEMVAGDFNGDSHPDLAVTAAKALRYSKKTRLIDMESLISVHFGNGSGGLSGPVHTHIAGNSELRLAVIRANADDRDDLVVLTVSEIKTLAGKGDGTFDFPDSIPIKSVFGRRFYDFDGDSHVDVLWPEAGNAVALALNSGDGTFSRRTLRLPVADYETFELADFNRDGRTDFLVSTPVNSSPLFSRILLGGRRGRFVPAGERHFHSVQAVRDFNGDGLADLLGGTLNLFFARRPPAHLMPDGTLIVTGTRKSDRVTISPSPAGDRLVVAFARTSFAFAASAVKRITVSTGRGNDSVTFDPALNIPAVVSAGVGNDTLTGGAAPETLRGDAGNDQLTGNAGVDQLWGGPGKDFFSGDDAPLERKDFAVADSILQT